MKKQTNKQRKGTFRDFANLRMQIFDAAPCFPCLCNIINPLGHFPPLGKCNKRWGEGVGGEKKN